MSDLVTLRPYTDAERALVLATWVRSYECAPAVRAQPRESYRPLQRAVCQSMVKRCTVVVADFLTDSDVQAGWTCVEKVCGQYVHHYTFVKSDYRERGIGSMLWGTALRSLGWDGDGRVLYTHRRRPGTEAFGRRGWVYAPQYAALGWDGRVSDDT